MAVRGAAIDLTGVSITLGNQEIVSAVDMHISAGEFVCLLGPSGCGKSTILNAIAGFLPVRGMISVAGVRVMGPGVDRGVAFQSTEALFPWLTARENVEYGPALKGVPARERLDLAREYLDLVGLSTAADKFPSELSGGMRQRLQIARVLVNQPSVVLMDEPFGALDAQTREVMQKELDRIWRATKPTILFVTHDIGEAILLADVVLTMTTGPGARIKSVHRITLAHPRDETGSEALKFQAMLRAEIGEEVGKVLRQQGLRVTP